MPPGGRPGSRTASLGRKPAGGAVAERSHKEVNMGVLKRITAVAMMVCLLGGPIPPPHRHPARRRHGFCMWHVFKDWLGCRRQMHRGAGGQQ